MTDVSRQTQSPSPQPSPGVPGEGANARMPLYDAMRFIAAVGVIWIHTVRSPALEFTRDVGRFAVPLFTLGAVLFVFEHVKRNPTKSIAAYSLSRFNRLYVPFLAWGAIYLAARYAKHVLLHAGMVIHVGPNLLLAGPAQQLWFLPFLFVVSVVVRCVAGPLIARQVLQVPVACVMAVLGVVWCFVPQPWPYYADSRSLLDTLGYWWLAGPSACFGISLAAIVARYGFDSLRKNGLALLGVLAAIVSVAWIIQFGRVQWAEHLAGVGLLFASLASVDGSAIRRIAQLGTLAYGVYLVHVLPMEAFQALLTRAGARNTPALDIVTLLFTTVVSVAVVFMLRRFRWTRWLA